MTKRRGAPKVANDFMSLTKIGLTKTQARCYSLLNSHNGLSTRTMATQLGVSRTTLYLLLKDLQQKGFVTSHQIIGPVTYQLIPLPQALVNYAAYQRAQVQDLLVKQSKPALSS